MFELTTEQKEIIGTDNSICVFAFSGAAKTTTLKYYAQERRDKKLLYLAFNRSIQKEAAQEFPSNATCKTAHSIAYKEIGYLFQDKLHNTLSPFQIEKVFKRLPVNNQVEKYTFLSNVITTIYSFLYSVDKQIEDHHVQNDLNLDSDLIMLAAKMVWDRMIDPNDASVPMLHDGYLKLLHIENKSLGYDIIMFDEAQDANPVLIDIVRKQDSQLIVVGDQHQQIYEFRGAVDALSKFNEYKQYHLTKSWRFGKNIADLATHILQKYKREKKKIYGMRGHDQVGIVDPMMPYAYLSRGNAALLDHAIECVRNKRRIYIVGGIAGLGLKQIKDIYNLKYGGHITDPSISNFRNYFDLETSAKQAQDRNLLTTIQIVKKYGRKLPKAIESLRQYIVDNKENSDVYLSTTHKAKGMEFNQVKLADDFTSLMDDGCLKIPELIKKEELNILYVAITRAKTTLETNRDLNSLLGRQRMFAT